MFFDRENKIPYDTSIRCKMVERKMLIMPASIHSVM